MEKLAFKLLELISLSLGLPADRFNGYFKEQSSFLRFNHYPPCPQPELALGVGRHKDGGALTVLSQDSVGGLQIQRRSDGEWISIKPTPDAYVINLGNAMQVLSVNFLFVSLIDYSEPELVVVMKSTQNACISPV